MHNSNIICLLLLNVMRSISDQLTLPRMRPSDTCQTTSRPCRGCICQASTINIVVYLVASISFEPCKYGSDSGDRKTQLTGDLVMLQVACEELYVPWEVSVQYPVKHGGHVSSLQPWPTAQSLCKLCLDTRRISRAFTVSHITQYPVIICMYARGIIHFLM